MTDFGLNLAIRGVDAMLRRRLGIVEFSHHPECVLRISRRETRRPVTLPSGAAIRAGEAVLEVHLWNDRMPPIPDRGSTAAWASLFKRRLRFSLQLLARQMVREPGCADIVAITASPVFPERLGPAALTRVCERLGWEVVPRDVKTRHAIERWLDSLLVWLLIRAYNPAGARGRGLSHGRIEIWMTRARLLDRYGSDADMMDETDRMAVHS